MIVDKVNFGLCAHLRLPLTAKRCGLIDGPFVCPTGGKSSIYSPTDIEPEEKIVWLINIARASIQYVASLAGSSDKDIEKSLRGLINIVLNPPKE